MRRDVIIHQVNDWSKLDQKDDVWSKVDLSAPEVNFGIHKFHGSLWSGGYVGVGRLYDKHGHFLQTGGKEHIIVVTSQYGMDPWGMLEAVMADDEYDDYMAEMEENDRTLFRVFYNQPLIRLSQDVKHGSEILYALSFITSCYNLCRKGLKKTMFYQEENYSSKVRGKIEMKKNIRTNSCRGRSDRFYCKYIDFTEDNVENRILKATLLKCKEIIGRRFSLNSEIARRTAYCQNAFRKVKSVRIKSNDFNHANASGLYMYYQPLLQQARCIFSQKYYTYKDAEGKSVTKSVFTIPYMINMESLFEFYARVVIKKTLNKEKYVLDNYSRRLFLQKDVNDISKVEQGIHLIPYCIPDIIIRDVRTQEPVAVIDAKYKSNTISNRPDTHQLLSYVLLTDVKNCGFVFPGAAMQVKKMLTTNSYTLPLAAAKPLNYYELIIGNDVDESADVMSWILPQE